MNKLINELEERLTDQASAKIVQERFHFDDLGIKKLLDNMVNAQNKEVFDDNKELLILDLELLAEPL